MGAAIGPAIGAGGGLAASSKGAQAAGESSAQAAALQQQALGLANPASAQSGRENFNQGVNRQVAGNFLGDQDLGPTSGFRDISGGNNFQFELPRSALGGPENNQRHVAGGETGRLVTDLSQNQGSSGDFDLGRTDNTRGVLDVFDSAGDAFSSAGEQAVGIGSTIVDPGALVLDPDKNILSDSGRDIFDPLQQGQRDSSGSGDGFGLGALAGPDQAQLVDFSGQGNLGRGQLGQLNQQSDVAVDTRIGDLANQQFDTLGGLGQQQQQLTQDFSNQLGQFGQQDQQGIQALLQQASGAPQDLATSLFGNSQGGNSIQQFLNAAGEIAGDPNSLGQFLNPLQNAQQEAGNLSTQVQQEADALISANEEQSRFDQEQATQSLNDQLAARGLSNSSAAIDALTSQNNKFSRGRAQDSARIRSQAQNQAFQQRLGALGQSGNLASIGGQLSNAGSNTQLRGADVGGRLGLGAQGQGATNAFNQFQAGRQNLGDIGSLLQQLNSSRQGTAQNQFGLNQQALNQPFNTLQQQQGVLGQNESRVQGIDQQSFANQGSISDRFAQLFSQLGAFGQQAGGQAAQISNQGAQTQFQNAANQGAGAGQAFGTALSFLGQLGQNQPQPTQNVGVSGVPTVVAPPVQQSGIQQDDLFPAGSLGF